MRRIILTVFLTTGLVFAMTMPASGTIHEIVASFCAETHQVPSPTGDIHDPPGLTPAALGGTSAADNVAQPLLASGAFEVTTADGTENVVQGPPTQPGDTLLVIDEDAPHVKLIGTDHFFYDPGDDVYVEIGTPDPNFPGFANCENLHEHS